MISVSNSVYMRLRAAVKEATGIAYGIAVSEEERRKMRVRTTKTSSTKTMIDRLGKLPRELGSARAERLTMMSVG